MSQQLRLNALLPVIAIAFLAGDQTPVMAAPQVTRSDAIPGGCDLETLSKSKAEFLRLSALHDADRSGVTDEDLRQASTDYVVKSESCYQALYGSSSTTQVIDDGGVWFGPDGSHPFNTFGRKWGAGSPFTGGVNVPGPRLPGGTVTYSFMANGVDISAEGSDAAVAISSLPTYSPCFLTEISNAFAAWSAVANIQFVQVADNGLAFNAPGAAGDIRIAAHTFDGPSGTLAHGYFPPPNGTSAAGDVHFDGQENWSCTPGAGIDIGIVATHEFGHAIGLGHEVTNTAVMNPFYNSAVTVPLADDINGASSIYGSPPVPSSSRTGDFDGDGRSDVTVFRPSNGAWYVLQSSLSYAGSFFKIWGQVGDIPVPGDFDGDGKQDVVVFRPSNGAWYILQSSTNFTTFVYYLWGQADDIPVQGDFDGDGKADAAVYRPSSGEWRILRSSTNYTDSFVTVWGQAGDIPVPGDFDGDGRADVVVYRPSNGAWYILQSSTNYTGFFFFKIWGLNGDVPVQGDFDGDGKADVVVQRPSNGAWYILQSSSNFTGFTYYIWGQNGDIPVPADFDGDGKTDVVVYRPSNGAWYILQSSTNFTGFAYYIWGQAGDIPVLKRP